MINKRLKTFEYRPLAEDQRTIRLIRILPGRNHSQIECELKHQPLIDDGHVCLSYMWGSSKTSKSVLVNGNSLPIGSNLWHFMSTARRVNITEWLWIDAICIDQKTLREKSHQVKLMSEIYRLARHVIIWPRNPRFELRLWRPSSFKKASEMELEKDFDMCLEMDGSDPNQTLISQYGYGDIQPLDQCLRSPYWNRLWVLQEIILAKRHFVLHESSLFDMARIDMSSILQTEKTMPFLSLVAHRSLRSIRDAEHPASGNQTGPGSDRIESLDAIETQIQDLLGLCHLRQCHDPKDRWYGILGLLPRGQSFLVDYNLSDAALMLKIISHLNTEVPFDSQLYESCNLLAESMGLWLRIVCGSCTLAHRQVYRQHLLSQAKPEASCLVVAVEEREALRNWHFREGNSFQCALCFSELDPNNIDLYLRVAFFIAENQMWCTVDHKSPTEADDAEKQRTLSIVTPTFED